MAYRIKGVVRIDDNGNFNAGILTAVNANVTGVVTATEFVGRISSEAITQQTAGDESDVTGADELLLYDQQTGQLLRVEVDEFVAGSGIGTIVTNFDNIVVAAGGSVTANLFYGGYFEGEGTVISGVSTLTGAVSLGSSLSVADGESIFLGDAGDLQITHSGANSLFIDNGTGNLIYRSGTQILQNRLGTKTSATFNSASSVDLSFNDDTKFRTANLGIQVAGVVTAISPTGVVTYYGDGSNLTDLPTPSLALDDLSDVSVPSPSNETVLRYNSLSSTWGSQSVSSLLLNASLDLLELSASSVTSSLIPSTSTTADLGTPIGLLGSYWYNLYVNTIQLEAGPTWTSGSGTPEGTVTASVGSLYTDTSGGTGSTLYVKESGTGNTGWVAK